MWVCPATCTLVNLAHCYPIITDLPNKLSYFSPHGEKQAKSREVAESFSSELLEEKTILLSSFKSWCWNTEKRGKLYYSVRTPATRWVCSQTPFLFFTCTDLEISHHCSAWQISNGMWQEVEHTISSSLIRTICAHLFMFFPLPADRKERRHPPLPPPRETRESVLKMVESQHGFFQPGNHLGTSQEWKPVNTECQYFTYCSM